MTEEQRQRMRQKSRRYERRAREADPLGYLARLAEKQRRRRQRDPERVRAEDRARYHADPERRKAVQREVERKQKDRDPDAFNAAARQRRTARLKKDPEAREKLRAYDNQRRARVRAAPGRGVSALEWAEIVRGHRGQCAYCGKRTRPVMDHVQPLVLGGAHDPDNVVVACETCNKSKGGTPLLVWLARRCAASGKVLP